MKYPLNEKDEQYFRAGATNVGWPEDLIAFQVKTGFWGEEPQRGKRLSPNDVAVMRQQMATYKRVESDFTYHAPKNEDQVHRYGIMRHNLMQIAQYILRETPPSREQSLTLTKLEEAMFWANAAIARNE